MLDIQRIRNNPEEVRLALQKRLYEVDFTELLSWDQQRRSIISQSEELKAKISNHNAKIGVIGLGYVGLPVAAPGYDVDAVLAAMGHDKKRAGKKLRFVIPQGLGDVVVIDDPGEDVVRRAIQRIVL